ncbi:SDR family NAD(P)-dependent oxidoreductase [Mangrovimicrobium sediminis]|uniref:SDR family NAD(P)-dependent oxidoreductase n=1 Tax=Mangrovimicrobium sediminis TaxID=2562682 RepID=A0A4Z0M1L4_9GAMM|nr:SDR family NAD(P)-dependent oxidoreductase [Haliea sp. SAOS-164]TGD73370.1 SDR family NAD(P)-dependent oxidoreductase [Haliea sp. SAOS-164]
MQNLAGKTAIVTGGAAGIGLGISRALLRAGMNVAIGDIQEAALINARDELADYPERLLVARLDVTDREGFAAFADAVEARFGAIHLLANNAGVVVSGPIAQASASDWDWVIDVNLRGPVNGLLTVLPRILGHGEGGHILNTASTSGLLPHAGAGIYTTTKAGLIGMSEALRSELEPQGVAVSVLCPGPVRSDISNAGRNRPAAYAGSGYTAAAGPSAADLPDWMMSADAVGELVREGIERDLLYILTHNEHRAGLEQRGAAILAALPAGEPDAELMAAMHMTLENPIFAAEIARQQAKG